MQKIIISIFAMLITINSVKAETITKTLTNLGINKSAVSVSIKEAKTGKELYALNPKTPMLPASTLKIITTSAISDALGADYLFTTTLYKSTNNDLYLKLSGDPFLTTADLEKLITTAKDKNIAPKTFFIDDTVFDKSEWGEGWQWDDDLNPLMPKFSAYNINKNLVKIEITPTYDNVPATIAVKPFYPVTFMNLLITDKKQPNNIKLERNNSIAPNMINISGTVSKLSSIFIPVNNPKINFVLRLEEVIRNKKLEYFNPIKNETLPAQNVYVVDKIEHEITPMLETILKNSNNLVAESLFKMAGSVWANSQGSSENSVSMLNTYLKNIDINTDDIKIVDGSGVSKNNLMTADFMTDFLVYKAGETEFETFKNMLPKPGEGTLKNRMLYMKDNLNAKTGTLSDTSAIAGYIITRRGKMYTFDIMINDAKTTSADKKNIEEQILRNIYANY
ncbi:MAG: D-alanyl-D-alanine carboxypeptidase/D-alanyl-D-alanine-endopeptidase [Candidatus Gastranaerophilaceae bacterium]